MSEVLLIGAADLAALMTPKDYLAAVEDAFRALKSGRAASPTPMSIAGEGGKFHAKGAFYRGPRNVAVVKVNGNFPGNPNKGLPTIQGVALLSDADTGAPLALMESAELTAGRTAAASALAARHLARSDSSRLAIIGCGRQAMAHARAISERFPLRSAFALDADATRADRFAVQCGEALDIDMRRARGLEEACDGADIIVTCTTAQTPFLDETIVRPGAFVAAVGADSPSKSEIAPSLMKRARIVVDVLDQCLDMGDLRHAVAAGAVSPQDVHADLGDIVAGAKPGRTSPDEIFVFDSTGSATQDAASALVVYERARDRGTGASFRFN